ncbi:hypothetical protein TrLO_g12714 [Triparma laevis f. longispina]|uniref:Uncharacterized protein n=1 Tax=Triparma laevis f. longispina TaxID=1714387 RepID=A0A9W7A9K7_9STRA|nr:hypothetical protein TrLO_g12714 [Triparma laevis f. longispina]
MGMSATFACVVDSAKGFPKYKDSIQIDEQIKVRSLGGAKRAGLLTEDFEEVHWGGNLDDSDMVAMTWDTKRSLKVNGDLFGVRIRFLPRLLRMLVRDTNFRVMISPKETSKSRNNPIAPYISDVIVIPATELKLLVKPDKPQTLSCVKCNTDKPPDDFYPHRKWRKDCISGKKRNNVTDSKKAKVSNLLLRGRKDLWTAEEDEALLEGINKYNFDWDRIKAEAGDRFGDRTAKALNDHFRKYYPDKFEELRTATPKGANRQAKEKGKGVMKKVKEVAAGGATTSSRTLAKAMTTTTSSSSLEILATTSSTVKFGKLLAETLNKEPKLSLPVAGTSATTLSFSEEREEEEDTVIDVNIEEFGSFEAFGSEFSRLCPEIDLECYEDLSEDLLDVDAGAAGMEAELVVTKPKLPPSKEELSPLLGLGLVAEILPPQLQLFEEKFVEVKHRSMPCNSCKICLKEDCGECRCCKDKKKFGGPGFFKKQCQARVCQNKRTVTVGDFQREKKGQPDYTNRPTSWSEKEDEALNRGQRKHGNDWKKILEREKEHLGDRTIKALQQRDTRLRAKAKKEPVSPAKKSQSWVLPASELVQSPKVDFRSSLDTFQQLLVAGRTSPCFQTSKTVEKGYGGSDGCNYSSSRNDSESISVGGRKRQRDVGGDYESEGKFNRMPQVRRITYPDNRDLCTPEEIFQNFAGYGAVWSGGGRTEGGRGRVMPRIQSPG